MQGALAAFENRLCWRSARHGAHRQSPFAATASSNTCLGLQWLELSRDFPAVPDQTSGNGGASGAGSDDWRDAVLGAVGWRWRPRPRPTSMRRRPAYRRRRGWSRESGSPASSIARRLQAHIECLEGTAGIARAIAARLAAGAVDRCGRGGFPDRLAAAGGGADRGGVEPGSSGLDQVAAHDRRRRAIAETGTVGVDSGAGQARRPDLLPD